MPEQKRDNKMAELIISSGVAFFLVCLGLRILGVFG